MTRSQIGKAIKKRRKEMRLSRDQMAINVGMSKWRLGKIERGEVNPRVDELFDLLKQCNLTLLLVDFDWIIN